MFTIIHALTYFSMAGAALTSTVVTLPPSWSPWLGASDSRVQVISSHQCTNSPVEPLEIESFASFYRWMALFMWTTAPAVACWWMWLRWESLEPQDFAPKWGHLWSCRFHCINPKDSKRQENLYRTFIFILSVSSDVYFLAMILF